MNPYLEVLKESAVEGAEWRGHKMGPWRLWDFWDTPFCQCQICGAVVQVDGNPLPNGIDISGHAVALNCPVGEGN